MLATFDISKACTGFALGGLESPRPRTGVMRLSDNLDHAITALRAGIFNLCKFAKVTDVYIEAPLERVDREHSVQSFYVLVSLAAVGREAAGALKLRCKTIDAPRWRRTFLGTAHPNDPKSAACRRCDELGWIYETHDAAEAAGMWFHGMKQIHPAWSPGQFQLAEAE